MKMCVIQRKNGTMMNVGVSLNNWMIGVLVETFIACGGLVHVLVSAIKNVNLMSIKISKIMHLETVYLVN